MKHWLALVSLRRQPIGKHPTLLPQPPSQARVGIGRLKRVFSLKNAQFAIESSQHRDYASQHLSNTMLRKMVFGPRGRISTDLDFTCCTDITADDLMLMMLEAVEKPFHGVSFSFDRAKDWYLTYEGCAANPTCSYADNQKGVKIKLQVSMRERLVLPVHSMPQLAVDHFKMLEFKPVEVPSLAFE